MSVSRGLHRKRQAFGCWVVVENGDFESPCHVWHGHIGNHGYGVHTGALVHRTAFTRAHGEIPDGLCIDHLCRNRRCVNPEHLEAVSLAENTRRQMDAITIKIDGAKFRGTHCQRGHDRGGKKTCAICAAERRRKYTNRLKDAFGGSAVVGGFGVKTNARIEAQRIERARKAERAAVLYASGVKVRKIAHEIGVKNKEAVYRYLKVAGVNPNRAATTILREGGQ